MTEPTIRYVTFEKLLESDGYLIYTSVGISMRPLLREHRDIIEIRRKDPSIRCKRYDAVLYKFGDKYILHRILKVRPKDYRPVRRPGSASCHCPGVALRCAYFTA